MNTYTYKKHSYENPPPPTSSYYPNANNVPTVYNIPPTQPSLINPPTSYSVPQPQIPTTTTTTTTTTSTTESSSSSTNLIPNHNISFVSHDQQQSQNTKKRIKLYENIKDRERFDNMATLYSIIIQVEHLEKAYVGDSIVADEYHKQCSNLITKFKTLQPIIKEYIPNVEQFMKDFKMACPAAKYRLLTIGVPATVEHGTQEDKNKSRLVAETVQYFITAMDALKLEYKSVDQLQPVISDLVEALAKVPIKDFDGKQKIKNWLVIFNKMKASDELQEEQLRQLLFELDSAYNTFHKLLSDH